MNRTKRGKTDTFILDFVNDTEDIVKSFQPYYTSTILTEETDPDKLYQMLYEIEQYNLYTKYQIDEFCKEFYSNSESDQRLHPIIDVVVDTYNERLNEEEQDDFKSKIQSFIRMYSYISQISSFGEVKWEKSYVFLRFLNKKLPKKESERVSVVDSVDLDSLRIQMMGETNLNLENEHGVVVGISGESGGGRGEDEKILLSDIIDRINQVFGENLGEEDKVTLEQIQQRMNSHDELKKVVNGNNSDDVKKEYFNNLFKDTVIDYHGDRQEFYKNVMNKNIYPMMVDFMFKEYMKQLGK